MQKLPSIMHLKTFYVFYYFMNFPNYPNFPYRCCGRTEMTLIPLSHIRALTGRRLTETFK
ncbi:hypothetical protein NECAME_14103 [Necator americanus]|uniref:Uncharacterized protein n=1 Tax=Necator americanus TaxID=51031 RepID=W2SPX2_NECAM|nr:hypothetical protein NECAME_14103 [Necator americanus]ETN71744.1 hypothetical protein NECAME_14103 [Necator americanus]